MVLLKIARIRFPIDQRTEFLVLEPIQDPIDEINKYLKPQNYPIPHCLNQKSIDLTPLLVLEKLSLFPEDIDRERTSDFSSYDHYKLNSIFEVKKYRTVTSTAETAVSRFC